MTILTLLVHLKSHLSSIKTPVKILHKVLHTLTIIVVTSVVIRLTISFVNDVLASLVGKPLQYRNIPICYDDDDDEYSFATQEYLMTCSTAITPDLPKSDSLIMEDKQLDTILETKSDELIKSSVEDLVHTPSEIPMDEVLDDIISIPPRNGNDHFNVESSPIESVLNRDNVISSPKIDLLIEEFCFFVFAGELALIAPIPSGIVEANLDLKGDIRFIEHLMYDNSFPRPLETLKDDSETVIDSNNDYSLSDDDSYKDIDYVDVSPPDFLELHYEAFYSDDDHINEKSSGSTTTHAIISQYGSSYFDLLINLFPPTDRSDFYHEEFADELAHIISPPDLECFYFKIEQIGRIFDEPQWDS
ncbi:hypothetical protein Tco_0039056 [Tanacetum coccineum]